MPDPEKSPLQKAKEFLTPASFIRAAQAAHPAFRYAIVAAGILAIVVTFAKFGVGYATLVFGAIALVFLMVLFLVFAQASKLSRSRLDRPAQVLIWAFLGIAIIIVIFLTSSAFFNQPLPFRDWIVQELAKSGPPKTPPAEVPVTLTAVYRDSHAPVAHTIFTVRDSASHIIHQEVMSDATGSAKFHLFPGKYELLTTGANENLTFVVTTIETTITVQVEPRASAAPTERVPDGAPSTFGPPGIHYFTAYLNLLSGVSEHSINLYVDGQLAGTFSADGKYGDGIKSSVSTLGQHNYNFTGQLKMGDFIYSAYGSGTISITRDGDTLEADQSDAAPVASNLWFSLKNLH